MALARKIDAEHKRKCPDYLYNPEKPAFGKLCGRRAATLGSSIRGVSRRRATAALLRRSARQHVAQHRQWRNKVHNQSLQLEVIARQAFSQHNLVSSRLSAGQQRILEEITRSTRVQVNQCVIYGWIETYRQLTNHVSLPG